MKEKVENLSSKMERLEWRPVTESRTVSDQVTSEKVNIRGTSGEETVEEGKS